VGSKSGRAVGGKTEILILFAFWKLNFYKKHIIVIVSEKIYKCGVPGCYRHLFYLYGSSEFAWKEY